MAWTSVALSLVLLTFFFCVFYFFFLIVGVPVQQVQGAWRSVHQLSVASTRDIQGGYVWLGWIDKVLGLSNSSESITRYSLGACALASVSEQFVEADIFPRKAALSSANRNVRFIICIFYW